MRRSPVLYIAPTKPTSIQYLHCWNFQQSQNDKQRKANEIISVISSPTLSSIFLHLHSTSILPPFQTSTWHRPFPFLGTHPWGPCDAPVELTKERQDFEKKVQAAKDLGLKWGKTAPVPEKNAHKETNERKKATTLLKCGCGITEKEYSNIISK